MSREGHQWAVRFTATAEADFQNIIDWTLREFGDRQARIHTDTLAAALTALAEGPTAVGAEERSEIRRGLFTLHVARGGRKGSHFVLFRVGPNEPQHYVEVLRLLHDAMDLQFTNT
jgi:toxin ParE1/3/4